MNASLILRIFSEATKIVKQWAKRRAIYHFNFGYLNGISIMIMVAKVMHLMAQNGTLTLDNASMTIQSIVEMFFSTYAAWAWSSTDVHKRTIFLPSIANPEDLPWSALSNCVMPIVCPYPPYKCTTL